MIENKTNLSSRESDLIRQAQEGDDQALSIIIDQHSGLINMLCSPKHLASETDLSGFDFSFFQDDLRQVAIEQLVLCVIAYDQNSNATLATFSYWRISHALRDSIKEWNDSQTHDLDKYYNQFGSSYTTTGDDLYYHQEFSLDPSADVWALLDKASKDLTPREEEIFLLHLHLNIKGKEIAKRLGLSAPMVSKTLTSAKRKLQKYFKKELNK